MLLNIVKLPNMKLALTLVFLFTGLNALANYSPGGVMVCGKKPTLYSFYEGSNPQLHNIKLWKDDRNISVHDYLVKALLRVKDASPSIFEGITKTMKQMQIVEVGFVTQGPLPEIPFVKQGCRYVEIANRQYDGKFLFVDMELFPRLSPMGQAGVIFQEAFFGYTAELESMDPDFARKFVARVFSDVELFPKIKVEGMTPEEKKAATSHICSNKLNALSDGVKIYLKAINLCQKEKDEPAVAVFTRIKKFMQETVDECLADCHWDEARATCERYGETIKMETPCD